MNLEFPQTFGAESERAQVKRLADYMYSLTEQLNYVLNHLDTDNFSAETAQALRTAETQARQAVAEAARMEQQQKKQAEALGREIVASAEQVQRAVEVKLEAGQAALLSTVSEQYAAKTETAALERTLRSALEQTAEHLTLRFDEANAYTLEVDGKLAQLIGQLQTYIRFGTEGIELGELGSPFTSLLGNQKLSFMQSGVEIAYISNHKMYITRAQVADSLTVGSAARGYYDFQTEPNGSFSLVHRSGEAEA